MHTRLTQWTIIAIHVNYAYLLLSAITLMLLLLFKLHVCCIAVEIDYVSIIYVKRSTAMDFGVHKYTDEFLTRLDFFLG